MEPSKGRFGRSHLIAALVAGTIVVCGLIAGRTAAIHLIKETLPLTESRLFPLKTQGLAFQRAAAHSSKVLPYYGSSELVVPVSDKASEFFRAAPTGFEVSPVGKNGTSSITILQKLAALGPDLYDRKIAIAVTPEAFLVNELRPDWYRGNFSVFAASKLAFDRSLDFALKRDIAVRMLQFPNTLEQNALLNFALRRLASGSWIDRLSLFALWPIGELQNAILDLQDHFEAVVYVLEQRKRPTHPHHQNLNWQALVAKVDQADSATEKEKEEETLRHNLHHLHTPGFIRRLNTGPEWGDFELLLRVLKEIRARPLLISMPLDGRFYDEGGVTRATRENYYQRIREAAQRYGFPLVDFEKHDDDPTFLDWQHTHFTAKGWMYCDGVLDDFYHDRALRNW